MKKHLYVYLLFAWIAIMAVPDGTAQNLKGALPGVASIKVDEETYNALQKDQVFTNKNGIAVTSVKAINNVNNALKVNSWIPMFPTHPRYQERHKKHGLHLWFEITFDSSVSVGEVIENFKKTNGITIAEPILEKQLIPYTITPHEGSTLQKSQSSFNDPLLPDQWHYSFSNQVDGAEGADINLFKAWEITSGSPNVIISVHDEGVDFKHEDLAANMWINVAELNGVPGVDDDGNGYIDDIYGYNFRANNGSITGESHGTHVAGTVAAVNNNGVGVSGVAGGSGNNDGVRIMSLQIFGNANTARSFVYAADNGAVISQNSWGYSYPGAYEQSVADAITYFVAEAGMYPGSPMKGGVVIAASGNMDWDALWYPAAFNNVISVSALNSFNKKASYSNFANWIDISAPGGDAITSQKQDVLSTLPNNKYGYMGGTSMAAPHVSGIAGLIVSEFGGDNFTRKDLYTHLLSAYKNIDELNPNYIGKLGLGAADAFMAVQKNDLVAPNKITDLTLTGIAQDFATLSWSAPADENDEFADAYIVYWNTKPITSENLTNAFNISIYKRVTSGTELSTEITDLLPLTDYYFSVQSMDRWGNKSVLSNLVEGTTNAGPEISFTPEAMFISLDASLSKTATEKFMINNLADGLLRWKATPRNATFSAAWNKIGVPENINETSALRAYSSPKIGRHKSEPSQNTEVKPNTISDTEMSYTNTWEGAYVIGEEDLTLTNSAALKFYVSQAQGFNLTHVNMLLRHKNSTGSIVLEIYSEELNTSNLIHTQKVDPYTEEIHNSWVTLENQLYFTQGETFWVVFHIPPGNLYPLGMAMEFEPEYSDYAFMSFDWGKRWIPLEEAINDDRFVWLITAYSYNKHLGTYISLNPGSGEVAGNSDTEIDLTVDASTLVNGSYGARIAVQSNDAQNPLSYLDVNLTVSGHKPELKTEGMINFGTVFMGTEMEVTIPVKNIGYGNFSGLQVSISNPNFEVKGWPPYSISARNESELKIAFKPSALGNANARITLSDDKGNSYVFHAFAVGTEPSQIAINPSNLDFDNVNLGDKLSGTFTISNTGASALNYVIPAFASADALQDYPKNIHKYGYTVTSSDLTVWNDISTSGVNISEFYEDVRNRYYPIEIGFKFPFYNELKESLYITNYGLLSFDTNSNFNSSPGRLGDEYTPNGYISALYVSLNIKNGTQIYYKRETDRFTVQYNAFIESWSGNLPIDFQIVLFDNGNANIVIKEIEQIDSWSAGSFLFAIENAEKNDGLAASSYDNPATLTNNMVFEFNYPGYNMISTLNDSNPTLLPGESTEVSYEIETAALTEGTHTQALAILSNDPFATVSYHYINVDIVSGGEAGLELSTETIDFASVFQGLITKKSFYIENTKTKVVEITSVALTNGTHFSINDNAAFVLKPGSRKYFNISLNTETIGSFTDNLVMTDDSGVEYQLALLAEVAEAPAIEVDLSAIILTLESHETFEKNLSVKNTGISTLEYSLMPSASWLQLETLGDVEIPEIIDYTYTTSNDANGPNYKWIDILKTGTKYWEELLDFDNPINAWQPIPMPFEFEIYGQKFDTLYTTLNGILTGKKWNILPIFNDFIPNTNEPNGFIAPLWAQGMVGMTSPDDDRPGIFYQSFDDYMVVTYMNMVNLFGMGDPVNVQAILYRDGSAKFQYQHVGEWEMVTNRSIIGAENHDGTDGMQIAGFQDFVTNRMAIMLIPIRKNALDTDQLHEYKLTVNANGLNAGVNYGEIMITTNVPGEEHLTLPVELTVNGEALLKTVESIDFGKLIAFEVSNDFGGTMPKNYAYEFNITNDGIAELSITEAYLSSDVEMTLEEVFSNPWWGDSWNPIPNPLWEPIVLQPGDSKKLRVNVTPSGTVADLSNTLNFVSNASNPSVVIPISATAGLPAIANVSPKSIEFKSNDFELEATKPFVIDNSQGDADLDFTLEIEYVRETIAASQVSRYNNVGGTLQVVKANNNVAPQSKQEYNRTLQYDNATIAETQVGFGVTANFIAATKFVAPNMGFNLTHVSTWFDPRGAGNGTIKVDVMAGSTIDVATILYTQTYETGELQGGQLLTFELSVNQLLLSGEPFYVVFHYPMGIDFPQGVVTLENALPNTFYYPGETGWSDVTQAAPSFAKSAYMVRAHEAEFIESGWITLSSSEGTLTSGNDQEIQVSVRAGDAGNRGNNKARVRVESNDVFNPIQYVDVNLHINEAPVFVSYPRTKLTVAENSTLSLKVVVQDKEGHNFDVKPDESIDGVSISKSGDEFTVNYTPGFDDAGLQIIKLIATDEHNASSEVSINVEVSNTNRAPIASDPGEISIDEDGGYATVKFSSIFTDPDGDDMVFTVGKPTNDIVIAAANYEELVLVIKSPGTTHIDVTATDAFGANASITLQIRVIVTGIESQIIDRNVSIYPNPSFSLTNIAFVNENASDITLQVYDIAGLCVLNQNYGLLPQGPQILNFDVTGFATGMYIVHVKSRKHLIATSKLIIK
jgi:subtilisin family serine protease